MSAATPLRIGENNGGGTTDELFLKVYGGEVLTAFETLNVMKSLQMIRTIPAGKSAQFPATWKVDASYHTVGAEIVGQTSNVSERVITIDDLLIADVFIPVIDEAKNHYEYRSEYSAQTGRALARKFDTNSQQVGVLAARASATVTGGNGGSSLTNAGYATTGSTIAAGIFAAAQALGRDPERQVGFVLRLLGAATKDLTTRFVVVRRQAQPGSEMFDRGPGSHIYTNLGDDSVSG